MARRLIPLVDHDWRLDEAVAPFAVSAPADATDRLAQGLADGNIDVVLEGRRRLQNQMVAELHRLVGEFVMGVETADTLYQKVGRAVSLGRKLLESEPPAHYVKQCVDPDGFERLCEAAADALVHFTASAINRARADAGEPPLPAAEEWVRLAVTEIREALELQDADGTDRMAELALRFANTFNTGAHVEVAQQPAGLAAHANRIGGERG
jgi:hypothetical protein